jgi:hypothetical protein
MPSAAPILFIVELGAIEVCASLLCCPLFFLGCLEQFFRASLMLLAIHQPGCELKAVTEEFTPLNM